MYPWTCNSFLVQDGDSTVLCWAIDVLLCLRQTEVEGQLLFTLVKALARHRVIDIHMGLSHSAVVVEPGHVYTFGRNSEGQLGTGNCKPQYAPIAIKAFEEKTAFVS